MVTYAVCLHVLYFMDGKRKKQAAKKIAYEPDVVLQQMGKRIKDLRIKKGYTSYEYFAYEHDIPRAQFGRYEQGQDLRMSSLTKIVNAFGMTLQEFFNEGFDWSGKSN